MKKIIPITILLIIIMGALTIKVNAATSSSVDSIYSIGSKYGMTQNDKQELQNFIDRNGITDAQTKKLLAKAKEAEQVMIDAGKTSYNDLTDSQKSELKSIANSAASDIGVSLVFKSKSVEVWKDGKKVMVVSNKNGKLAYTGNNNNVITLTVIAVSSVAVIALAAVAMKKRSTVAE